MKKKRKRKFRKREGEKDGGSEFAWSLDTAE